MYDDFKEELKDAYAEIERLRAALEQIAGCEPYMIGEWAIILARAALTAAPGGE